MFAIKIDPVIRNLGLLLGVQLVLAAGLLAWQAGPAGGQAQALFAFDSQAVDRLVIEGPGQARVELQRRGEGKDAGWVVAQAGGFPADAARVRQVVDKLHGLKSREPMATSPDAIERFKVADAAFERRLQAQAGGKTVATLLLGTSQGRLTSARKPGDAHVLGVDWSTHELGTQANDWLDKSVLRVAKADVEAVEVDGTRFDPAAADRVAQALAELSFQGLRGRDASARQDLGKPEVRVQVQRRGGGPAIEYVLYKPAGGEDRVLVVSNRPETFTLAEHQARPLLEAAKRQAPAG
ncbi:MAG TPA: DUF4340 domain-containing protein [Ramlibacter sp.]|nr:DUF4340 domain-containing protein [Ramlibacter sp.]